MSRTPFRRWLAVLVVTVVSALAAGCGDDPVQNGAEPWSPASPKSFPGPAAWGGEVVIDRRSGEISAPGFNDHVESTRPEWAKTLDAAAAELLNLNRPFDGPVEIYLLTDEDGSRPVATFTLTRLGDDSVDAERYRVVFDRGDDGLHRFVSGRNTRKCHSDRGHQSFSHLSCL